MAKQRRKAVRKVSDKQFWEILEANGASFSRTAREIGAIISGTMTRQSVRERALKNPERLEAIEEKTIEIAREGLVDNMLQDDNLAVKQKAIEFYLKTKGKNKGWTERKEISGPDGGPIQTEEVLPDLSKLTDKEKEALRKIGRKLYK